MREIKRERGFLHMCTDTMESLNTTPLCMLALGKTGEGAYAWDPCICVMTITDHRMPCRCSVSALFLAVWWAKLDINEKIRHDMTQMASLLAVFTILFLWTLITTFYNQRGGFTRDKTINAGT